MIGRLSEIIERIRSAENDSQFQLELVRIARMGLWFGGVLGVMVTLLFVGTKILIIGDRPAWRYAEGAIVLWDKSLLLVLSLSVLVVADRLGLRGIRLLAAAIIIVGSLASVVDDMATGDTSFAPGILIFMYLVVVVGIPFRPAQTLVLGTVLMGTLYAAVEFAPPVLGLASVPHDDGHYIYFSIMTVLLTGLSGLLYTIRLDQFRARRRAEEYGERLAELESVKSRFFANISHELRTPLTLILGPLEDAAAGRLDESFMRRIDVMREQARKLRNLVDQLLDLSRLEDSTLTLSVAECDLGRFVREQTEMFRTIAERRGLQLTIDTPDAPIPLWFDRERIGEVVSNLVSNAIKFTERDGTVRVRVACFDSGAAEISVRDNGAGIDAERLEHVFDRFHSSGRSPDGQVGTGIGLALVKEIVDRHGGSVRATSEPGFGTEFFVGLQSGRDHFSPHDVRAATDSNIDHSAPEVASILPAGAHDDDGETEHRTADPDAPLVVVVDDNDLIREYIRSSIEHEYRVEEAADGEEAWNIVREHRPDLVVSDVFMPVLGGLDLCSRIREDAALASIPVILITAGQEDVWRLEGWRTGADAFLAKPFTAGEVLALAENLIAIRNQLADLTGIPDWMDSKSAALSSPEAEFMNRLQQIVGRHIGDSSFGVEWLADEIGLSARQLQRRLKKITRLTAAGFIKTMRMEHAARLLATSGIQVQEAARAVGYEDAGYFSTQFRQIYGLTPSEYSRSVDP
jgi:signal transduction histidine kinase/AraC-like DNA-binding protein